MESEDSNDLDIEIDTEDTSKKKPVFKKKKNKFYCSNCGKIGHLFKHCNDPVTSYGVITVLIGSENLSIITELIKQMTVDQKLFSVEENNTGINASDLRDIENFAKFRDNIKFLLIKRKHTLGFIEFVRGRYNIENVEGIIFLFKQMTPNEIDLISKSNFDQLWEYLWRPKDNKQIYQTEYIASKAKFDKLRSDNNGFLNLNFYVQNVKPTWNSSEWGFPKGRRNYQETDEECALREFTEETGFNNKEFILLKNIKPIEEQFIGTNGVSYKHIYYIAIAISSKNLTIDPDNVQQNSEIGDIDWFTFDDAIRIVRPYHTERKRVITELYMFLLNRILEICR